MNETIEKAVLWALDIAADAAHGYDQSSRWGPDYDCSSLVISAYKAAGLSLGCTYTGNMRADMLARGFADVTGSANLATGAGLMRGDVLLNEKNHTALYIGAGQIVQASINERGSITGGQTGDQTGGEIAVRGYYNYPWDCVLRFGAAQMPQEAVSGAGGTDVSATEKCAVTLPELSIGAVSGAVLSMQLLLIHKWAVSCGADGADGDFGPATAQAVKNLQTDKGLTVDGIVGANTWANLIKG